MSADFHLEGAETRRRERRAVLVIVLVAVALRLALFLAVRPWVPEVAANTIVVGDAIEYHNLAKGIIEFRSFGVFRATRTPGYPVFVAGIYSIAGANPWAVLLAHVFIGTGSVLLLHRWAKLAVGPRAAVVAAALLALEPHSVFFTVTLLTETLFVFVFLASMLALMQGIKSKRISRLVLSSVLLGIATLVRPICQFFPVIAIGIVLLHRGIRWPFRLKAAAVIAVIFVLTISPWLYRNHAVYGHASLSCLKGANLLFWGATSTVVARTGRPVDEVRDEFLELAKERGASEDGNPFDNSRIYQEMAMTYIKADFGGYVARHWKGIEGMFLNVGTKTICDYLGLPSHKLPFYLFAAPSRREMIRAFLEVRGPHEIAIAAVLGLYGPITYLLAIWASLLLFRRRKFASVIIALAVVAYFCLFIGTNPHPRYKLPVVPFYVTLSGLGLLEFWRLAVRLLRCRTQDREPETRTAGEATA